MLLLSESIRPEIGLIDHSFSGGVELDEDGHFFTNSNSQKYVGEPSPQVDEAWNHLLSGKDF
jgi:hypothetical protein